MPLYLLSDSLDLWKVLVLAQLEFRVNPVWVRLGGWLWGFRFPSGERRRAQQGRAVGAWHSSADGRKAGALLHPERLFLPAAGWCLFACPAGCSPSASRGGL